jgi:GntR family transcriptional regulator
MELRGIAIDPSDRTPIYAQLERSIRVAIATGRLKTGDQLPTVRQLAVELRVNANTVARVYLALEREGALVTKRGVGTFIAAGVPKTVHAAERDRKLNELANRFLTEATSLGFSAREVAQHISRKVKEGA